MTSRIPLVLSLFLLVLTRAWTQSAEEFFHRGAQHYLDGTNELARVAVTNGLRLYPNDPRLTNLWELLNRKQQQQQQQQQQQNQENQDKKNQDQQSKDQQEQEKQKQDRQKKDEEQKKQEEQQAADQKKKENEEKQGEKPSQDQAKEEGQEDQDGTPQPARMMKMTPQQALQFLDTLRAQEKTMPFRPILRTNRQQRVFKDW